MKNYAFILVVSFIYFNNYAQKIKNGSIKYLVNIEIKQKNLDSLKKVNPVIFGILKNQKTQIATLNFKSNQSIWHKEAKMNIETESTLDLVSIRMDGEANFYTNLIDKKIITSKNLGEKKYLIESSFLDWKLSNETKKIGKYKVYKATALQTKITTKGSETYKIIAWYCPKIPINFGPKEFSGLPGLIIELKYEGLIFQVKSVNLNLKKIEIKKPQDGIKVNNNEFNDILKKANLKMKRNLGFD